MHALAIVLALVAVDPSPPKADEANAELLAKACLKELPERIREWRAKGNNAKTKSAREGAANTIRNLERGIYMQYPRLDPAEVKPGDAGELIVTGKLEIRGKAEYEVIPQKGPSIHVTGPSTKGMEATDRHELREAVVVTSANKTQVFVVPVDKALAMKKYTALIEAAAEAKKALPPEQDADKIAAAKLELAKKATKPETRLRLLREVVENYPASTSAAEAEKLLAEEPKE